MRIVYVIEGLSVKGGLERILTDKMNYLAEHTAHEIVLMTVWHEDGEVPYPLSPKIRRIKLNVPPTLVALPLAIWRFNKYIKRTNPDITVFFRAIGAMLRATTTWKGRKIFESHLDYHHSNHNWLYPHMQRKADTVVCLTQGDARNFKESKHTIVIPDFTTIKPVSAPDYSSKRCIWVGRLEPEKAPDKLVRLWKTIHASHPEWRVDMYGEGRMREQIQNMIASSGLANVISLHGVTDNIAKEYQKCSFLIMTSECEGMGMVLIEANACGLPAIAFDCPHGPSDIIKDKETGFLIDNNDTEAMTQAVMTLIEHDDLRQHMGQNAVKAAKEYSPERIMSMWLKLFTNNNARE